MARRTQKLGVRIKQGIEAFEPAQIGKKSIASNFLYQAFRGQDPHHPFKMLLIGETGSGKTSFLNLLCNCATVQDLGSRFGAEDLEQFKQFNDIRLENAMEHAMQSKTTDAKRYNVEVGDLKVGVIDSPGFGDSRGLDQDKRNAKKIVNALKTEEYINCVCLIINGRHSRATVSLKYVLSEITAILPRDILNNVIIVFSNTSDALRLNFDQKSLTEYFGKKIDKIFCVENPYCRFEKAQTQKGQLEVIASSLKKSFEDTGKVLSKLCTAIKDFPRVHTHRFVELYEKKQAIESTVFIALNEYDSQMRLEKEIRKKREEVSAALGQKELGKEFRTTIQNERWVAKPTDHHNTLCAYTNCYSNCHAPCSLPKAFDKESFKSCRAMEGGSTCSECGHSYIHHYHGEKLFEKRVSFEPVVNGAMSDKFNKATSDEERAQLLYQELEKQMQASKTKRQQLSEELVKTISEFETLGIARNYIKLIENQLALIDTHIEASIGPESEDLRKTRDELKKRLKVVQKAKKSIY